MCGATSNIANSTTAKNKDEQFFLIADIITSVFSLSNQVLPGQPLIPVRIKNQD
jgi:hypothetical protein